MFGLKKYFLIMLTFLLFMFVGVAVAQESGALPDGIDWASLGVNVGVIGSIIAVVQFTKQWIPASLVIFAPILLSVIAFFVVRGEQPIVNVFYWAAAAGYLWKIANKLTPDSVFKTKSQISNGG